jgi:hypothetical protein
MTMLMNKKHLVAALVTALLMALSYRQFDHYLLILMHHAWKSPNK